MKALIEAEMVKQIQQDMQRVARRRAAERVAAEELVIRSASTDDDGRLQRLALLDSAPAPHGPMLVGERGGMLVAAVPMSGGRAIADPFEPSADVVGLLELRRAQLRPAA